MNRPSTIRAGLRQLQGCTCRPVAAAGRFYSAGPGPTASSSGNEASTHGEGPASSGAYSTPQQAYKYSNPSDAYDSSAVDNVELGAARAPPLTFPPDPFSPSQHPHASPAASGRTAAHHQMSLRNQDGKQFRAQRQQLSKSEAQAFADLLSELLPQSTAGETLFGLPGQPRLPPGYLSEVQAAVGRKTGEHVRQWERRARSSLSAAEEDQLDQMREQMASFHTDYQLLNWSTTNVFGFTNLSQPTLFPDPRTAPPAVPAPNPFDPAALATGPSSRIFPDLLLSLFLLLRDTHKSPHTALHAFQLAAATAHSYVSGCTTELYNEVLRTRWAEGDVEAVAAAVDEMQRAGVKMNAGTSAIVSSIGEAIRADGARAERRAGLALAAESLGLGLAHDPATVEDATQRVRFFSGEQVAAWARMDRDVEESKEAWDRAAERRRVDSRTQGEVRRRERERAERDLAERESPSVFFRQAGDPLLSRSGAGGRRGLDGDRSERDYYADEGDDDGIDSSWRNFPVDKAAATAARSPWDRRGDDDGLGRVPARQPVEHYEPWAALDDEAQLERRGRSLYGEDDRRGVADEYDDGPVVLPKRPSFANPFKIRRAGRTKAEKAGRDTPHPMLAFRNR